jgi:hypothetical protein
MTCSDWPTHLVSGARCDHADRVATRRIADRSNGCRELRAGRHLSDAARRLAIASGSRGQTGAASRPVRLGPHLLAPIPVGFGDAGQIRLRAGGPSRGPALACRLCAATHPRRSRDGLTRRGNLPGRIASRAIFGGRGTTQVLAVSGLKRAGRHNRNCHQNRQKFPHSPRRYVLHLHRSDQPDIPAPRVRHGGRADSTRLPRGGRASPSPIGQRSRCDN